MKKVIGIILALVMVMPLTPCAFAEGLVLSGSGEDIAVDGAVEFGFLASDWAMDEIESAQKLNLIPELLVDENLTENVTRAEFAAIAVMLYENLTGEEIVVDSVKKTFNDIEENPYYDDIESANFLGITNGTSENTFSPDALITREQMATMLTRALSASGITTDTERELSFDDNDEISEYAENAVRFMAEKGIINGVGENKFAPKATATREQAIIISYRCVASLEKSSETIGNTLKAEFVDMAEYSSAYEIAESLTTSPAVSELYLTVMEVEPGYLTGFDNTEITGFDEGAMFAPMIGSIPFVGYVFTLENPENAKVFAQILEGAANPRWNICVRAEETIVEVMDNKVFFVMCNSSI